MAKCSIKVDTVEKVVKEDVKTYVLQLNWEELRILSHILSGRPYPVANAQRINDALRSIIDLEES